MKDYTIKYYLSHDVFGEREVTKEEFIKAERAAGFYPNSGNASHCATGGFSVFGGIAGSVRYIENSN